MQIPETAMAIVSYIHLDLGSFFANVGHTGLEMLP